MHKHIEGIIAAPFTAMNSDGSVNLDIIETQAEFLRRNGIAGVFVCGTTGEGLSLSVSERIDIAQRWSEVAADDFKVIVHAGHTSLASCKALAASAQKNGAWAIGMMAPFFFKVRSIDTLIDFCAEVAGAAPQLPFYYYHIPHMTGASFSMVDFLKKAPAKIPNLVGIKFAMENLMEFELCRQFDSGHYDILFGKDELLVSGLVMGARGAIGTTYNFASPLYIRIIEAFKAGDMDTAVSLQRKSMELVMVLAKAAGPMVTTGSFSSVAKAVMKMVGLDCGAVRLPLENLTPQQYNELQDELREIDFFEYCSK